MILSFAADLRLSLVHLPRVIFPISNFDVRKFKLFRLLFLSIHFLLLWSLESVRFIWSTNKYHCISGLFYVNHNKFLDRNYVLFYFKSKSSLWKYVVQRDKIFSRKKVDFQRCVKLFVYQSTQLSWENLFTLQSYQLKKMSCYSLAFQNWLIM